MSIACAPSDAGDRTGHLLAAVDDEAGGSGGEEVDRVQHGGVLGAADTVLEVVAVMAHDEQPAAR